MRRTFSSTSAFTFARKELSLWSSSSHHSHGSDKPCWLKLHQSTPQNLMKQLPLLLAPHHVLAGLRMAVLLPHSCSYSQIDIMQVLT